MTHIKELEHHFGVTSFCLKCGMSKREWIKQSYPPCVPTQEDADNKRLQEECDELREQHRRMTGLLEVKEDDFKKRNRWLQSRIKQLEEQLEKPSDPHFVCPGCKGVVTSNRWRLWDNAKWHEPCFYKHFRTKKIARARRRLRRWRTFKQFLSDAFWRLW